MSGFFNFLKSLFSGIFSIFSKKKSDSADQPKARRDPKSKYFMELDEAKALITDAARPTVQKSEAKAEAPAASPEPTSKPAPAASKAETVAAPAKADPQPAKTKAEPKAEPAKQPEPVAVANALNLPQPTVTFAPTYLAPTASSNGRRRPGANMASFLDMARQVKTPG